MTHRTVMIIVAVPFVLVPLAVLASKSVSFERAALKPSEIMVLEYSRSGHEDMEIMKSETRSVPGTLARFNPFSTGAEKPVASSRAGNGQDEPSGLGGDGRLEITLTVVNPDGGMAVINGRVLREGDSIGGMRVERIENNRVLMVDRQSKPIYLEGSK